MTREFYGLEIIKDEETDLFVVLYLPKNGGMRKIEDIESIILCNVIRDGGSFKEGGKFRSEWGRCESYEWDSVGGPESILICSNGLLVKSEKMVMVYNVGKF